MNPAQFLSWSVTCWLRGNVLAPSVCALYKHDANHFYIPHTRNMIAISLSSVSILSSKGVLTVMVGGIMHRTKPIDIFEVICRLMRNIPKCTCPMFRMPMKHGDRDSNTNQPTQRYGFALTYELEIT